MTNVASTESPLKFDFELFLRQLRSRKADPILRYIKSFLSKFGSNKWTTEEQVKLIEDFKGFIFEQLYNFEPFAKLPEPQLENARVGLEKLIMTKLYEQCYSPEIEDLDESHKKDIEIDQLLLSNYDKFANMTAKQLDVDESLLENGDQLVELAQQELEKINSFRAPRAKTICLLNSCKILFQLIKNSEQNLNADEFLPLLIYTVLKAKIPYLYSNVCYIDRFTFVKNSEHIYYLVSLNAALEYVRNLGNEGNQELIDL